MSTVVSHLQELILVQVGKHRVSNLNAFVIEQDILQLQVPVDHTILVVVRHSGDSLPEEMPTLLLRHLLTDVVIQLTFAGIFHNYHSLICVL